MEIATVDIRSGYFYEALLNYSIRHFCSSIHAFEMHKKLTMHSVASDVIIPSASSPKVVILCTHSQSEKGTAMKIWRNIDEMLLIRESFPSCKIVNLLFPSKWKHELILLMNEICDYQIVFPERMEGSISRLTRNALKSKIKASEEYLDWLHTNGGEEAGLIASYLGQKIEYAYSEQCVTRPEWAGFGETVPHAQKYILNYRADCLWKKGCGKIALIEPGLRERFLTSMGDFSKLSAPDIKQLRNVGILFECEETHGTLTVDKNVAQVLRHDSKLINGSFSLIHRYHQQKLQNLTAMVNPAHSLGLREFVNGIPRDNRDSMSEFFFEKLIEWRDFHPGEQNAPLS